MMDNELPLLDQKSPTLIQTKLGDLEEQITKLESCNQTNELKDADIIISSAYGNIQKIVSTLQDLASDKSPNAAAIFNKSKDQCNKLENRLQNVSSQIIGKLKKAKQIVETHNNAMQSRFNDEDEESKGPIYTQAQEVELKDAKYLSKYLEMRQVDLDTIETTLRDIHQITENMSTLVQETGVKITSLAQNIETAHEKVIKGKNELKKAEAATEQAGQKSLYLIICLIFLVALLVMLLNSLIS